MRRTAADLTLRPAAAAGDATVKLCADCPPRASIYRWQPRPPEDIQASLRGRNVCGGPKTRGHVSCRGLWTHSGVPFAGTGRVQ